MGWPAQIVSYNSQYHTAILLYLYVPTCILNNFTFFKNILIMMFDVFMNNNFITAVLCATIYVLYQKCRFQN